MLIFIFIANIGKNILTLQILDLHVSHVRGQHNWIFNKLYIVGNIQRGQVELSDVSHEIDCKSRHLTQLQYWKQAGKPLNAGF